MPPQGPRKNEDKDKSAEIAAKPISWTRWTQHRGGSLKIAESVGPSQHPIPSPPLNWAAARLILRSTVPSCCCCQSHRTALKKRGTQLTDFRLRIFRLCKKTSNRQGLRLLLFICILL